MKKTLSATLVAMLFFFGVAFSAADVVLPSDGRESPAFVTGDSAASIVGAQPFSLSVGDSISKGAFTLERRADTLYVLRIGRNEWRLPFPVYQFDIGDVDGDGNIDAIVGVEKSTRFFHDVARRVFIFKNYKGFPRGLWFGSRLGSEIIDFRFIADERVLRLLERRPDGTLFAVDYRWGSFGMVFDKYL